MQQLAREAGAVIGGTLYSDSLSGPTGPGITYLDMFRHNASEIARAFTNFSCAPKVEKDAPMIPEKRQHESDPRDRAYWLSRRQDDAP